MNEMKTTAVFTVVAVVSLLAAWLVRPQPIRSESEISNDLKGQLVFKELEPSDATTFRIVKFNEELASLSQLELARDPSSGAWTLPSSDGYPADSAQQISQAIAPLTSLTVLSTVSTDRGDHELYGVVEPKEEDLQVASKGVGTLVRVGGGKGDVLASLIIGKAVEGAIDQRYVRIPSEDAVFVVELKTDAYTTQFEKWIKNEVLAVRSLDINYVGLRAYEVVPIKAGYGIDRNFDSDLTFKDNKWTLNRFVDHRVQGAPETNQLPDGKVLADNALNELRNSVQNLKIVNVRRKPAGLAKDLKADESLLKNTESTKSLNSQGFFPMQDGEVFAAGGELIVGTKDGIQYLLRFGNTALSNAALDEDKDKDKDDASKKDEDDTSNSIRRYLLVTAKLDQSKFPVPELKLVPETVEQMLQFEAAEKAKLDGAALGEQSPIGNPAQAQSEELPMAEPTTPTPAKPGDTEKPAESSAKPEVNAEPAKSDTPASNPDNPAETKPDQPKPSEPSSTENPNADPVGAPPAGDPPKSAQSITAESGRTLFVSKVQEETKTPQAGQTEQTGDKPAAATNPNEPTAQAPAAQTPAAQTPATQTQPPKAGQQTELTPSRKETREELEERLLFVQESIKKENKRLLDARNDSMKAAQKKVDELNYGFADWYYLVSENVYTKLRVSRDQLFKAPDAKPANAGADSLGFPPNFGLPPGR